jgi:hypothetical protein
VDDLVKFWGMPYERIFQEENLYTYNQKVAYIKDVIWQDWKAIYEENSTSLTSIARFPYEDFVFLYDDTGELVYYNKAKSEDVPEGRVVAAYGISKEKTQKRNNYRVQSYLGPTSKIYAHFGDNYDKGHFIGDATGGPKEINLFPQKRDINRGWSEAGKIYRRMERFIAQNPGTFFFSRPFYNDFTLRPIMLEFGYVSSSGEFVHEIFDNV